MIDPKESLGAARSRAHKAKKTAGRLLVSGIGFSAAYFLDPDHGQARRKQAFGLIDHLIRSRAGSAQAKGSAGGKGADLTAIPTAAPNAETRQTFRGAANGVPSAAR